MTHAAIERPVVWRGDAWRAFAAFCAVALALAAVYLASALAFADLRAFADPNGRFGLERIVRFNTALGLVFSYLCASLWLGQRWIHRDFDDLRPAVEATDAEWEAWRRRAFRPDKATLARAAAFGFLAGIVVDVIGARAADAQAADARAFWIGHRVWVHLLNPMVFSVMGLLVATSAERAAVYQEIGRRARVSLGEIAPLAPFARVGLRTALLWFLGTSLASLLLVDTNSPMLVLFVLVGTTVFAGASLIAPSRGVHERMREAKRQELAWLRGEIARAAHALRAGDAAGAAQLPALVAWEARVADAPVWPFDAGTALRFSLFLLMPLGSWLGGAFAERAVNSFFG
jgi:hypothetical protein